MPAGGIEVTGTGVTVDPPPQLPDLVTLDQTAAAVHRKKPTLEKYKRRSNFPSPTVEGAGDGRTSGSGP